MLTCCYLRLFLRSCQFTLPWSYGRSGLRSKGYIRFRKIDIVWIFWKFLIANLSLFLSYQSTLPWTYTAGVGSAVRVILDSDGDKVLKF